MEKNPLRSVSARYVPAVERTVTSAPASSACVARSVTCPMISPPDPANAALRRPIISTTAKAAVTSIAHRRWGLTIDTSVFCVPALISATRLLVNPVTNVTRHFRQEYMYDRTAMDVVTAQHSALFQL